MQLRPILFHPTCPCVCICIDLCVLWVCARVFVCVRVCAMLNTYHIEGIFGGRKLWWNGKEMIVGRIDFGSFMIKVYLVCIKNSNKQLHLSSVHIIFVCSHAGWVMSDVPTRCLFLFFCTVYDQRPSWI